MKEKLRFSAMRKSGEPTSKRVKMLLAALLLTVLGIGSVQAQCEFSVSDFTVNASDGSDDMPYDDMVTLNYSGSEALDSIHFIITETSSGLSDSTNVTYDVDESRWYVQFSYLTAGNYTISLRPYCSGQASTLLSNGNTWSFTIECTPENASPVIDDIDFEPVCNETTTVTLTVSSTCGTADNLEFYIDDPDWNGDPDNYDGTYDNVTPGEHIFTVVNVNNSRTADTTITITEQTTCETVLAGSSELSISGFSYEDYDNTGNFGEFYYVVNIPTINGDYVAVEAQYYRIGTTDTNSTYLDMGTGRTTLNIPINAKGDWVVRMRARCCGYNPGNVPGDWLLTDTIHHYPNFTVESVTGACSGNDAQATVRFTHPFNISNSNIGVRISPVGDPSDITFTQTGVSGSMIDLQNLAAGDYKMYVYISDGTDENTYNAYLDTTFTIETRVKVTIENDNARVCENTTDTLRANVSGGTEPYTYQWYYDGDYPDLGDGSNLLAIPNGPSNYVTCIVKDANNCQAETYIEWDVLPAFTEETQNYYDDYSYDEIAGTFHVPQNLCPLNRFGITFDCSEGGPTMDVNFQSVDGCDSIKQLSFSTHQDIGIPGGGILDTTISSGAYLSFVDDGGGEGFYSLNSHGKAIIRAAGGERDLIIVYVTNPGTTLNLSDEDTLRIYKEESEMALGYNREGTWNQPGEALIFASSSGAVTINFNTGSKRGFDDGGEWKGYRMENVGINVKSPDQLTVTPICGGSGSVQVTNPTSGIYYCLTNPGGATDTIYSFSTSNVIIFNSLTEAGSYTLRSYFKPDDYTYQSTDQDTTFTVPAGSFELSVEGDSTTVCSVNPSVTLTASVTGGEAPYAYSWSDGSSNATTTVSEAYATPTVTVTDNSGCAVTYTASLNWIDYVESDNAEEASVCESATTYTWNSNTVTIDDEHLGDGYYIYYDTVESAGTCPTIAELHLTVKPNATVEEHVVAWGTSYTWPVDGNSYATSLGGYSDTVNGCPVTVEYGNDAATATHSGVAANGCDSIYALNLTLIYGIPIPATGTTDTTLATMVEGDTVWVYDNGGMMHNYDIEGDGILILRAPENHAIKVAVKEMALGDGGKVFYTEEEGFVGNWYYENNGDNNGTTFASNSGYIKLKYDGGDTPAQGKGFKLAVTFKSLDDTCMSIYNLAQNVEVYGQQNITWQHTGRISGYRVKVGSEIYATGEYTPIVDTIVTDTTITLVGDWTPVTGGYYPLRVWAVCAEGDTSTVYSAWLETQCGFRPGLADGEMYTAPATMSWSEPSNNNFELYGQMPPCWSRRAGSYTRPDTNLTYPMLDDVFGGDANWMALYFYTNADVDQYAAMPKFDTTYGAMNSWALKFTLELADYNHGTECEDEPVVLYVGVMDNYLYGSTFTAVDSIFVNRNDYTDEANKDYYVSLAGYNGSGLYPAFKMARRSMHNENDYANPTLMLYDVMVVPDGGLEAPSNVTVTKHPTDDRKAVISWTEPAWPQYNDDYSTSYVIELTNTSGSTFTLTADYDATSSTFDATAGEQYKIQLYYKVSSARYSSSWMITDGNTYRYERPLYEHLTVDTIGDLSDERLYSYVMPFEYGNESSSEILIESTEIDATAIDAIAFRMPPQSCIPETSFQRLEIYMKDVTLTELDAQNMTDDYLFDGNDLVVLDTTTTGGADGWLTFTLNQTYTHDPDKNILIGIASWPGDYAEYYGGYTKFYMEDNLNQGMALWFEGASDLTEMPSSHEQYYRPQMKLIGKNNCTNDTLVVDTNLCENASLDWRGQTISFSDPDIESHKVQISTYNYIYVYTDKVEEVTASGCDSIYKLQITKRYNEDNNYDIENSSYPHETSCGPYTWRNGVTYDYNMGTYQYDDGGCPAYGFYGPRAMDTVRGVATYGCDSIYGLNLTVNPWYTVVFDTTGVDAGTGMEPVYRCEGSDYTLPECTMTMAYKAFTGWYWADGDTTFDSYSIGSHVIPYSDIDGDTILLTPIFECVDSTDYTSYEDLCPVGGEYEWHGHTVTMQYAMQHGMLSNIDMINFYEIYDTVHGAVGGVCDSVYHLRLRMENKLEMEYVPVCPLGYTWIDGNHYDSDTAVTYIDSAANNGCGVMHFLSIEADDPDSTYATDTVYFIRYYVENATELDTLHSMTMYVCDGYKYVVPELPDTATREGYDFVTWSDNPACGWTVDPGDNETADASVIYLYGMWESNCSNDTIYDTTTVCVNDTVEWHGFTWRGAELELGTWDTTMTKYGVIPGECDSVFMLTITVPSIPMLSVTGREDPLCYGDQNGWISVAVDDGNAPFQYALGDSSYTAALDTTGHKFENLAAGSHTVWVKDACGVTDMAQVEISTPNLLTVNVSSYTDSAVCYEAGKQLNAEVSGGTGIYTYMWNNDTNRTNDTLMVNTSIAGTRTDTVVVTDENGCTAIGSYTTLVYDTMTVTVNGGDTTYCYGATAVPITVTVTGGDTNSGYTYTWYDYNQQTVQGESITVPTNAAASYSQMGVTVSNSCGTKQLTVPTITVLDSFYVGPVSEVDASYCFNATASQIEVPVTGGGAFIGQWYMNGTAVTDHNPGDADNKYTPRTDTAGTFNYSLKITSNAGCGSDSVTVGTITVYEPYSVTVANQDTNYCLGQQADTLRITSVTGGSGSYGYYWLKNGSIIDEAFTNNYFDYVSTSDINAGSSYSVNIADLAGCFDTTVSVATIIVNDTGTVEFDYSESTFCLNSNDYSEVFLNVGGQFTDNDDRTYQWYENGTAIAGADSSSYTMPTTRPGTFNYTVKITGFGGCLNDSVLIATSTVRDAMAVTVTNQDTTYCYGANADTLRVTSVTGGSGEYNYTWYRDGEEWDWEETLVPSTTESGTIVYSVKVSDANCYLDDTTTIDTTVVVASITVRNALEVNVEVQSNIYCLNSDADTITLEGQISGNGSYNYQWYAVTGSTTEIIDTLAGATNIWYVPATNEPGDVEYRVKVTDLACGFDTTVSVRYIYTSDSIRITSSIDSLYACPGSEAGSFSVTYEGDGEIDYDWYLNGEEVYRNVENEFIPSQDTPGVYNYYLVLRSGYGCASDSVVAGVLTVYDEMVVSVANQDTAYCFEADAEPLSVNIANGSGNFAYRWYMNGEESMVSEMETYQPSTGEFGTATYSVHVTDNDCGTDTIVTVATITVSETYTAYFHCQECDTNFMPNIEVCSLTPQVVMPENEYEYEGHIFIGWIGSPDTVQPGDTVTISSSIEFWAAWRTECSNIDTVEYATICEGDSITWRGMTIDGLAQEYSDTVAGVVDVLCDSVYHLLLTVNYPSTSDTTILACDSVWWNNMFFTETPDTTQSYFMARADQNGCDSTAYLNLTVNYSIHDYVVETACDSYTFDSVTYTESTDLPTIGAISDNGCPFITHISLTVNYSYHGEDSATACDMYVWNDMELTEGGDHDYVGYTSDGCDSVVTLHLTMHYTAYGMDTQTACDSLVWIDGNTYFSDFPGDVAEITYLFPGASMYGCDSVAVLDLTMEDHIYVEFISDFGEGTMNEMSSCIGKPFAIPQCEYVNEGFVFDGWVNQVVHDTVMPGDTVFLEESTSFIAAWTPLCEDVLAFTDTALCEGSSFVWRGHDYTNELYSGDYEDVAYAVIENYCDSIYYLRLTVYPVSYNEFYDSVVGSVIWYDEEYTTTGDYSRFCGYNRYGCDSTEVLHLIVNLGIDEKEGEIEVKVYPNPTQGIVNLDGVEIRRIAVLDQVGRAVATFDNTNRIDISDLPAGIYTLYVQTSEGETTRRVVKR